MVIEELESLEEGVGRLLQEPRVLRKEQDELQAWVKVLEEQAESERNRVRTRVQELQNLNEALLRLRSERGEMRERVGRILAQLPANEE
ncbi:MAG: hypothetical protein ACE5JJ_01645 [Nitrospinota bacterium]